MFDRRTVDDIVLRLDVAEKTRAGEAGAVGRCPRWMIAVMNAPATGIQVRRALQQARAAQPKEKP